MKKYLAFSLAEALITLLIVCIIAIASAPMITKKAKKSMRTEFWQRDMYADTAVSVRNGYDIRLGSKSDKKDQSIVVVGTLYFKDRNGNVIGWISEDGTSSFSGNSIDRDTVNQLMAMFNRLYSIAEAQKQSGYSSSNSDNYSSSTKRRPYVRKIQPKKIQPKKIQPKKLRPATGPNVPPKLGGEDYAMDSNSLMNVNPAELQSQLQGMDEEQLQQMLNQVMQLMPAQ